MTTAIQDTFARDRIPRRRRRAHGGQHVAVQMDRRDQGGPRKPSSVTIPTYSWRAICCGIPSRANQRFAVPPMPWSHSAGPRASAARTSSGRRAGLPPGRFRDPFARQPRRRNGAKFEFYERMVSRSITSTTRMTERSGLAAGRWPPGRRFRDGRVSSVPDWRSDSSRRGSGQLDNRRPQRQAVSDLLGTGRTTNRRPRATAHASEQASGKCREAERLQLKARPRCRARERSRASTCRTLRGETDGSFGELRQLCALRARLGVDV